VTTLDQPTGEQIVEVASRSEFHANAVSVVLLLQAALERQRRIIYLQAELARAAERDDAGRPARTLRVREAARVGAEDHGARHRTGWLRIIQGGLMLTAGTLE